MLAATDKKVKRELTAELRKVAEPIRADAESLAASRIPRIGLRWPRMRVGVTQKLVYVAPRERGVRARGPDPRRRPKFADLMEQRAMDPALKKNEHLIEGNVEALFEHIANGWNRR